MNRKSRASAAVAAGVLAGVFAGGTVAQAEEGAPDIVVSGPFYAGPPLYPAGLAFYRVQNIGTVKATGITIDVTSTGGPAAHETIATLEPGQVRGVDIGTAGYDRIPYAGNVTATATVNGPVPDSDPGNNTVSGFEILYSGFGSS